MSSFNSSLSVHEVSSNASKQASTNQFDHPLIPSFDFSTHLEKMVLFLAQTWRDDNPDASSDSDADLNDCIMSVKTELAIAGSVVGGPAGVMILTGGNSAMISNICRGVLSSKD